MDAGELSRLEQFVDRLLGRYNELKEKYNGLEVDLEAQKEKCLQLEQRISELHNERTEVSSRVSGLISRIEHWESEEGGEGRYREEQSSERPVTVQGNLFSREGDAG